MDEVRYPCWVVAEQRGRRVRYRARDEEELRKVLAACCEARPPVLVRGLLSAGVERPLPA